jgi:hypothetical protein
MEILIMIMVIPLLGNRRLGPMEPSDAAQSVKRFSVKFMTAYVVGQENGGNPKPVSTMPMPMDPKRVSRSIHVHTTKPAAENSTTVGAPTLVFILSECLQTRVEKIGDHHGMSGQEYARMTAHKTFILWLDIHCNEKPT